MRGSVTARAGAAFMLAACVLLAGCQQLGLAPAASFESKLAYAYGSHAAVQSAAAQALDAHELSSADGTAVLQLADQSRALLDAARAANAAGDTATADGRLMLASSVLTQLEAYLRSRTSTKPPKQPKPAPDPAPAPSTEPAPAPATGGVS